MHQTPTYCRSTLAICPAVPAVQLGEYDAYVALMRRCWAQDPAQRPDFSEVIIELRAIMAATVGSPAAGASSGSVASA